MKKFILFGMLLSTILFSNAQIQRQVPNDKISDSGSVKSFSKNNGRFKKNEMMQELNLSKQQKNKIKEIRQFGKAKIDEVNDNTSLTEQEKKVKIRELRKQQMENVMAQLNPEQKIKMREIMMQNQRNNKTQMDKEIQ